MTRGEALLAWYTRHRRDLPWRSTDDPYRILVSEVMLQQTQAARVVSFYERFLSRFPSVHALARAPLSAVLETWEGLGYPSRAKRLREAARLIERSGWPATVDDLVTLPGVGSYTAAAVASFAFGARVAVVDTNVKRVLSRWRGTPLTGKALRAAAHDEIHGDAATWNQATMELGALVCRRRPVCDACPVARECIDPDVYERPATQSPYRGSHREARGAVLRALTGSGIVDRATLFGSLDHPDDRLADAVTSLRADGLVIEESESLSLAE